MLTIFYPFISILFSKCWWPLPFLLLDLDSVNYTDIMLKTKEILYCNLRLISPAVYTFKNLFIFKRICLINLVVFLFFRKR
jgi:hypothetical protein